MYVICACAQGTRRSTRRPRRVRIVRRTSGCCTYGPRLRAQTPRLCSRVSWPDCTPLTRRTTPCISRTYLCLSLSPCRCLCLCLFLSRARARVPHGPPTRLLRVTPHRAPHVRICASRSVFVAASPCPTPVLACLMARLRASYAPLTVPLSLSLFRPTLS
jgi:hypothetical protein